MFFATLGVIASSIERIATEIRHMQRTEVLEAEEFFSKGQKGSSAMPHKRNPVLTENLTGLARLVRMAVIPAMENVALWHERDISHSSVERAIGPDATVTLDFALARLTGVIDKLWSSIPTGCAPISTGWAGWSIPSGSAGADAHHILVAGFLEIGPHHILGIGFGLGPGLAEDRRGPQAQQPVAPRHRLEIQLCIMGELGLIGAFALVESGHRPLLFILR
jgi:hypothetical protein